MINRRAFLHVAVASSAAACTVTEAPEPGNVGEVYPQGVASGDPRPESVVLWTRVEPRDAAAPERIVFTVAANPEITDIVAQGTLDALPEHDHTVRIKVEGLAPYTTYYYRFHARGTTSVTGRTKTAPTADDDVPVRLAQATCQDYRGRYYHAWRALVEQEVDVDFVVHTGDYIYEKDLDVMFGDPTADRSIDLPDGKPVAEGELAAVTVADYRTLYKTYRSDPDLQEAHRLYPFIVLWDDHEFANDSWQDHSTDFGEAEGDEQDTPRRQAATQAWFEYQPVDIAYDPDAGYPDDITIYRSFRFGLHVELLISDGRYYRDDHLIPEGPVDLGVAKATPNSALGSRNFVFKTEFDIREAAAEPTMLGAEQRDWLIQNITGSSATWKLWASATQLAQYLVDLTDVDTVPMQFRDKFYLTTDQWDGYRSERAAILGAIESSDTNNVITLCGDVHAFYACELYVDFDVPTEPVAVELTTAAISSSSIQEETLSVINSVPLFADFGIAELVENIDDVIQAASPHYKYLDSDAHGITVIEIDASELRATMIAVGDVRDPDDVGETGRTLITVAAGESRLTVS